MTMISRYSALLLILLFSLFIGNPSTCAQTPVANEKSDKYLTALVKRPFSKLLFERFFESWLENGTIEDCTLFLQKKSADSPAHQILLAQLYLRQGYLEQASNSFQQVLKGAKSSPDFQIQAALQLAQIDSLKREYSRALQHVETAIEVQAKLTGKPDPKTENQLGKWHGRLLIKTGAKDRGLKAWQDLLAKRPDDELLREDIVDLLVKDGLFDQAIKEQQTLIALADKHKDVHQSMLRKIDLGKIFIKARRRKEALTLWQDSLPIAGHDTWMEREIIALIEQDFRRSNNIREWRETLDNMISNDPKRLALHLAKAKVLTEQQQKDEALETWRQLLQLSPGNQNIRLLYVNALVTLGQLNEAADQLSALSKQSPEDEELYFQLGDLLHQADRDAEAGKSIIAYLDKSDGSEYSYLRAARKLQQFSLIPEAGVVFDKLANQFPQSNSANDAFARFLYDTDRKTQAIQRWQLIGKSGNLTQLLAVIRQLNHRSENTAAFDLLYSRFAEFDNDILFLEQICLLALELDKKEQALDWSLKRLQLSPGSEDLHHAISLTIQIAKRHEKLESLLLSIKKESTPSINKSCLLAAIQERLGDPSSAITTLSALTPDSPAHNELILTTLSHIHRRHQNWEPAAAAMEKLITSPGGYKPKHISDLVSLQQRAENYESALRWVREWKKLVSGSATPWSLEASLLDKLGQPSASLKVLQDASRRFAHDDQIQIKLARAYARAGHPSEAGHVLWKLYESSTDDWKRRSWIKDMVELAQRNKSFAKLIERFQQRRRNNSQSISPLLALAEVHRLSNNRREQRDILASASRLAPDNIQLIHQIASLDQSEGRTDSAIAELEKIKEKDQSGRITKKLAQLYMSIGRVKESLALVEHQPAGKVSSVDELLGLAQSAMILGEWQVAADFLAANFDAHPDDVSLIYLRAIALAESGQNKAAEVSFLSLLNREIPKVKVASMQTHNFHISFANRLSIDPLLDPLRNLQSLTQGYQRAASYRKNFGQGEIFSLFHFNYSYQRQLPIPLPTSTSDLQGMSLRHLHLLQQKMKSEEQRASLDKLIAATSLPEFDVSYLKFSAARFSRSQNQNNDSYLVPFKAFLLDNKQQAESALLWLQLAASNGIYDDQSAETFINSIRRHYGDEYYALALFKLLDMNTGKDFSEDLAQAVADIEKPSYQLIIRASRLLVRTASTPPGSFSVNLKSHLLTLLDKTPADEGALKTRLYFLLRAQAYAAVNDHDAWIQLLKTERQSFAKKENQNSQKKPIPPIGTPPLHQGVSPKNYLLLAFPGFSPALTGYLSSALSDSGKIPINPEKWIHHFDKDPILLALLATASGQKKLHTQALENLRKISKKDGEQLFLSAALVLAIHEIDSGNNEQAARLLGQIKLDKPGSLIGKSIDLTLVRLAIDSAPDTPLRNNGMAAALRLRLSRLVDSRYEWPQVSQVLTKWKMPDEARRPAALIAHQVPGFQNRFAGYSRFSNRQTARPSSLPNFQSFNSQLARLQKEGSDDAVVRISAHQLPLFSSALLSLQGENNKVQLQRVKKQLEQKKLIPRILKMAQPAKDAPLLQRVRFAALNDALDQNPSAIKLYTSLLTEMPGHAVLRLRRFQLLAQNDPIRAQSELKILAKDPSITPHLGTALHSLAKLSYPNMEKRLEVAEWLLSIFDQLSNVGSDAQLTAADPFADPGQYRWATQLAQSLSQAYRDGDINYPSLGGQSRDPFSYDPFSQQKKYLPKKPEQLLQYMNSNQKRSNLLQQLLTKQIDSGTHSKLAFASLVRLSTQLNKPNSELLPFALQTLRHQKTDHRPLGNISHPQKTLQQGTLIWKNPNLPVPLSTAQSPLLWILEYAFQQQQPGILETPQLLGKSPDPSHEKQITSIIKQLSPLYFCKPEEFSTIALELLTLDTTPQSKPSSPINRATKKAIILRALALRPKAEKYFPWQDFIVARLSERNNSHIYHEWAKLYCRELSLNKGAPALSAFVDKLALALVGAKDQQKAILASFIKPFKEGRSSADAQQQRLKTFVVLLASLTEHPETAFYALDKASDYGIENSENFTQYAKISQGPQFTDQESVLALFKNPYLIRNLENYHTFPKSEFPKIFHRESKSSSVVATTLNRLKGQWKNKKNERLHILRQAAEPEKFGGKLLAAILAEKPDLEILAVFHEDMPTIKKLPIEKQKTIALFASDLIDFSKTSASVNDQLRDTVLWLQTLSGKGPTAELEKIIVAKSISDLDIQTSRFMTEMRDIISQAISYDWEKSYAAFENAAILGERAVQEGHINKSNTPFTEQLLKSCVSKLNVVENFRFVNHAMQSERLPNIFITSDFRNTLGQEMRSIPDIDKKVQLFAQAMKKLAPEVNSPSAQTHVFLALHDLLRQQPKDFKKDLLQWARDTTLQNALSKQVELALLIEHHVPVQDALSPQQFQYLLNDLERTTTTSSLRLLLSTKLFTTLKKSAIPDKIILLCADNLASSFKEDGPDISDKLFNPIIDVFSKYVSQLPQAEKPVELLDRLATSYSIAYLSNPPHPSRISESNYSSNFIAPLLTVLLQADKHDYAHSLLKKATGKNFYPSQSFTILVREGVFDLAAELLEQQWEKLLTYSSTEFFDKKLSQQFQPFLDSISSRPEWMKWIAKNALLRNRSPYLSKTDRFIPETPDTWPKQSERQAIIRDSLKVEDFTNKKTLQQAYFSIKSFTPVIPDELKKALQEINRDQSLSSIAAIKDYKEKKHAEQLFYELLASDVADGKMEQWNSILLADLKKNTTKERMTPTMQNLLSCLTTASKIELTKTGKRDKQARKLLHLWNELSRSIPTPRTLNSKQVSLLIYPVILSSSIDNVNNTLDQYFSTLPEALLTTFSQTLKSQSFDLRSNLTRITNLLVKRGHPTNLRGLYSFTNFTKFTAPYLSRAFTTNFAKIDSFRTIAKDRKTYINAIAEKLTAAARVEDARLIFDHACALIDKEVTAGNPEWIKDDDNGWIYPSVFFHEYCKKASIYHHSNYIKLPSDSKSRYSSIRASNWLPIALLCDILWNDSPPNFSFTWSNIYRLDETFSHHWKISNNGDLPDLPLDLLFSELRKSLPADQKNWGDTSVFLPIFYETFRAIRDPKQVVIAIKVADQLADKEVLAREFSMAGRLWLASYLHLPEAAKDLAHPNAWVDRANEAFDSESLSPSLRASLARHFLYRAGDNCPEKLQRRIITEVTALIMNDAPFNGWELSLVSNALLRMPRDNDWWQGATEKFITAWNHKSRFDKAYHPKKIPFAPNLDPVITMLALQFAANDKTGVQQTIKLHETLLKNSAHAIALLIRYREYDQALSWVSHNLETLQPLKNREVGGAFQIYYDEKLDRNLDEFLKKIKSAEQRLLIGSIIVNASLDFRSRNNADKQAQNKRIASLAKGFAKFSFSSENKRKRIQQYLSTHHQTANILSEKFAQYFQSADIEKIPLLKSHTSIIYPEIQPLACYATNRALQGDPEPLRKLMLQLASTGNRGSKWPYKVAVEQIAATLFRAITLELNKMSPAQLKSAQQASQIYFDSLEGDVVYNQLIYLSHSHVVLNALLSGDAKSDQWKSSMQAERQKHFQKILRSKYVSPSYTVLDQLLPTSHSKFKLAKQALEHHVWLTTEK